MEALEILVVILSVFLAIFLALGIALLVLLVQVTKKLNDLADRAEVFAGSFGANVLRMMKKSLTPSMVASGLFGVARKAYKRKQRKRNKGGDDE